MGYTKDFIDIIEIVYGDGFLSSGSFSSVDLMFNGIDLDGEKALDIGSGLGGIDIYLAQKHNVDIAGIDIEPLVVKRAKEKLLKISNTLIGKVKFILEEASDYLKQFENDSFDIVFSKEVVLHIPVQDKVNFFKQACRVLKKGGKLIVLDWMHKSPHYSKELINMIEIDGIPYNLVTKNEYFDILEKAGFKNTYLLDTSEKTVAICRDDCKKIIELKNQIIKRFGKSFYDESLLSWTKQKNIFEQGELLTGIFYANKL